MSNNKWYAFIIRSEHVQQLVQFPNKPTITGSQSLHVVFKDGSETYYNLREAVSLRIFEGDDKLDAWYDTVYRAKAEGTDEGVLLADSSVAVSSSILDDYYGVGVDFEDAIDATLADPDKKLN